MEREGTLEGNVRVCLLHIRLYNLVVWTIKTFE